MFYFTRQNNANIVHVDLMASDGDSDMFVGDEDHYGELGERRERLQWSSLWQEGLSVSTFIRLR